MVPVSTESPVQAATEASRESRATVRSLRVVMRNAPVAVRVENRAVVQAAAGRKIKENRCNRVSRSGVGAPAVIVVGQNPLDGGGVIPYRAAPLGTPKRSSRRLAQWESTSLTRRGSAVQSRQRLLGRSICQYL